MGSGPIGRRRGGNRRPGADLPSVPHDVEGVDHPPSWFGKHAAIHPQPGWVTVHFNHLGIWQLQYWIGLSTADSTNQSQLVGGGAYASWTYAFWARGGTFRCGATYVGPAGNSTTLAWVNASWGVL